MIINPWLLAIRPKTLPAAIGPLLIGNMLAYNLTQFSLIIAIVSMLCAILLQISVNLANDYFDHKSGVDTADRVGPIRVTQSGLLPAYKVKRAMIASLIIAVLIGFYLIAHGGWPIALLAIAAVCGALGYSGGPYPLASHGLGELAAFIYFGHIAVVGSYFLQAGETDITAWLLGTIIGLFNAAIMLVNNTRDIETDRKAGKHTLAVRVGLTQARSLYQIALFLPFALTIGGYLLGILTGLPVLLSSIAALLARSLSYQFNQLEGAELNQLLAKTAQLTLLYSVLFSLGLYLSY